MYNLERAIYSLPTKHGGLATFNPVEVASLEYQYSIKATKPLCDITKQHI